MGSMGKKVIIFEADMSSSVDIDNKNKDILILGEEPTQGLDDTTLTAEAKYPINFTQPRKRLVLSLHYNGSNSFLFVHATKIYQFKAKDSEIKDCTLCYGNISKGVINNMNKTELKGSLKLFSVDFNPIDTDYILDIHKYLMKKTKYKTMFWLVKKMFIVLLSNIVNGSNHTKCMSLSNQKCMIQPTLISVHSNEYSQEFHYYPFAVKLDRCVRSCNTLNDLSNKVRVRNKTEDLSLSVFNMIIGINESKTLARHYHANVNLDLMEKNIIQINGGIMLNVNVSLKNIMHVKKIIFGIIVHVVVKTQDV